MQSSVAVTRCADYNVADVRSAVRKTVDLLGGIKRFVKEGELILVKPNLLAAKPAEAAVTTHPSVVASVIELVREAGGTPVVGDSPGIGSARKIAEKCGVMQACRDTGAEFMELKEIVTVENPMGHTFKRLEVGREVLEVDGIINLPKLKTHAQMYLTLGVKNLFGCVPGNRKPQWHLSAGVDSLYFASMLLDLYLFLKPRLTVMDGIIGMEGNGPGNGDPRALGLVIGGENAVAIDTVIAAILGTEADKVPVLKAAKSLGLKGSDIADITVLGERIEEARIIGFKFPPLSSPNFASRLPYALDRSLRKALTSRPHIDGRRCTLCGACVSICPARVMSKSNRITIDYDNCIRCYCCQEVCPDGAISPRDGWLKKIIPGL